MQVFQKIQKRLNHGLSKHSAQQLEQRLAQQYEEYLHTVNTTAGVFRDTIDAKDYNPLAARSEKPLCSRAQPHANPVTSVVGRCTDQYVITNPDNARLHHIAGR